MNGTNAVGYLDEKFKEIFTASETLEDEVDTIYNDILCGANILNLMESLNLTSDDTLVIFSLDGAQLYQDKESDAWIGIWIIVNYNPITRYQKKHILPAFTIPGLLRLQMIKAIVDSCSFKSPKSEEPRRVQVLDLYCLTRFESEGSSKRIVLLKTS